MILLCEAGQPELVVRNVLALTGLANFRLVGNPSTTSAATSRVRLDANPIIDG